MSAFTYPGVYIEELSSGVHTITGVATSIAAFVGWAPQGPVTEATLVESWSEYETIFGGLDPRSKLGYAVNQFFANGGQQAYIVRLIWGQAGGPPPAPGTNPAPAETAIAAAVGYAGTQITATANSIASPSVTLYVGAPVLQSISITPGNLPPIPLNATGLKFTATGINSDSSQTALTSSATWGSSAPSVISVAGGGVASIIGAGTAIVTATDPTGLISVSRSPFRMRHSRRRTLRFPQRPYLSRWAKRNSSRPPVPIRTERRTTSLLSVHGRRRPTSARRVLDCSLEQQVPV
jgi:hypothetical protein